METLDQNQLLQEIEQLRGQLAQTELREKQYRTIVENSAVIISRFDRHLRHLYVSQNVQHVTGVAPADYIGKTNAEVGVTAEELQLWDAKLHYVFDSGQETTLHFTFPGLDGTHYFQVQMLPEYYDNTTTVASVLCFAMDITERILAEQERVKLLEENKALDSFYRTIFESVDDAVMVADEEGNYLEMNPAALRMLGYTRDELFQIKTVDIVAAQGQGQEELQKMVRDGFWQGEIELITKDGAKIIAEANAKMVTIGDKNVYVNISRDTTWRRRAEEELHRKQEQLQTVMDNSSAVIYIRDLENRYLLVNRRFEELLNFAPGSVVFKTSYDLVPKEIADQWHENDLKVAESGQSMQFEEPTILNGEARVNLSVKSPLFDKDGQVYAICGISSDITERKKSEQALRDLDDLKNLFVSIASHELRNPLTTIQGFARLLERNFTKELEANPDSETKQNLERNLRNIANILRPSEQMDNLISQLLDFSRLQNQQLQLNLKQNVQLQQLVEQVVEQQQLIHPDNSISFSSDTDAAFSGTFDEQRVEQVLNNLISNAIKYSPAGSPVEVSLKLELEGDKHCGIIAVRDYGYGISEEDQKLIFNRFYRVKDTANRKIEGLGLGLYIGYEIIAQHGGTMWVESEKGEGSTFSFSLPLY